MELSSIKSNRWNNAAKYGLLLGLIPSAYLFISHLQLNLNLSGTFASFLGLLFWVAKFVGCIALMKYAMKNFACANTEAKKSDLFKLGALMALFSAFVFAVVTVADQVCIFPEYYQSIYAAFIDECSKVMQPQQIEEIKDIVADAPKYSFIGTFLYCLIYGTILSFILSRNILPKNPVNNCKPDDQ